MSTAEYAPNATSSIGAVWPPQPSSNDRLKGFYPDIVETSSQLREFNQDFWHSHNTVGEKLSRTTVRFVGSSAILGESIDHGMPVEAAMPLAGGSDLQMIYVGVNKGNRITTDAYFARHQEVIRQSRTAATRRPAPPPHQWDVRTTTGSTAVAMEMGDRFMGLYETFGFSEDDVTELLENPDNTIAYLQNPNGEILSTCLAERGVVDLGRTSLSLYEITEAVTRPDMRGRGYYTAVSAELGRIVRRELVRSELERGNLVGVYGESNLSSPGVIRSALYNGREIAAEQPPRAGNPRWGILPQNFGVNDGTEERPFNDFALTYFRL